MKRKIKLIAGPIIIVVTVALFARYLAHHPQLVRQLGHTPPLTIVGLLGLYVLSFATLVLVLHFSLRIYGKQLGPQENVLLNAYSSLLNFFGPGQSGPALRGAYLKKRHGLGLKNYTFVTLLYLLFFAIASAVLLCVGSRPWWQTCLLVAVVGGVGWLVLRTAAKRQRGDDAGQFTLASVGGLALGAALQCVVQVAIYFVELHSISPHVSLAQTVTYTGAANFALFVALTPGAIGIRESFLLFTQHLHHIPSATIVAANVIDRAVYIAFLGLLFVVLLGLHAKRKLHLSSATKP